MTSKLPTRYTCAVNDQPVDDLLERERPQEPVFSLSSVLENFAAKEKGDGLIQIGLIKESDIRAHTDARIPF